MEKINLDGLKADAQKQIRAFFEGPDDSVMAMVKTLGGVYQHGLIPLIEASIEDQTPILSKMYPQESLTDERIFHMAAACEHMRLILESMGQITPDDWPTVNAGIDAGPFCAGNAAELIAQMVSHAGLIFKLIGQNLCSTAAKEESLESWKRGFCQRIREAFRLRSLDDTCDYFSVMFKFCSEIEMFFGERVKFLDDSGWPPHGPEYIPLSKCVELSKSAVPLTTSGLSKILRAGKSGIRFVQNASKARCRVHVQDFLQFLDARKNGREAYCEEQSRELIELRKREIARKKT